MPTKIQKFIKISLLAAFILLLVSITVSVSAQNDNARPAPTQATAGMQKIIQAAGDSIFQRVNSINKLISKVNSMKRVSEQTRNTIMTSLQNEIGKLDSLKTKIDADTVPAVLQEDVRSVSKSIRVYMLVLPQANIIAASDKTLTIIDAIKAVLAKIQTRISQLPGGTDITSLQALITDINTKLSDATTKANEAVSAVSSLTPDNGDQKKAAANTAAINGARSKLKLAISDLRSARKNAGIIITALKNLNVPANINQ